MCVDGGKLSRGGRWCSSGRAVAAAAGEGGEARRRQEMGPLAPGTLAVALRHAAQACRPPLGGAPKRPSRFRELTTQRLTSKRRATFCKRISGAARQRSSQRRTRATRSA